ncbi:MAG: DinB family protein [Acidobacteriia bacterium]|nr:DinB family protein [Terriglobia bacterium]
MNYYSARELAESFRTVRKNTILIAQDVPEEKYAFRAFPEARSVGELLAHIALACGMQYQLHAVERRSSFEGFDLASFIQRAKAEEKQARNKGQIVEMLRSSGEKWAGFIEGLSETFLAERVHMPPGSAPPSRSRFEMILSVKEHEMHHRGQLMLLERLFGIVPHLTREMQARMAAAGIKI